MKNVIILIFFLVSSLCKAQTIKVVELTTREPLPGVVFYDSKGKTLAVTNSKGELNLNDIKQVDTVWCVIMGYEKKLFTRSQVEQIKEKIQLRESNINLNEVIVSANRWEESKIENPGRINVIKRKEIEFQNAQTTADMLGSGGNVYIQKSQQAGGSPMLRGFGTNRVLLVIDGVRMNNAIFRSGNVQNVISLDANAMENAEILFGPGAVMYGSDAIGGVMDFHTKKTLFSDSANGLVKANGLARFSTANIENTGHLDLQVGFKKIAFVTSFTTAKYEDLLSGTIGGDTSYLRKKIQVVRADKDTQLVNTNPHLQVNSKYSQINFMQKIAFKPTQNLQIDYAIHHSESTDAPRYDRLITDANSDGILDFSEWYYGPQLWQMHRIGIQHKRNTGIYNNLRFVAAYQHFEESRHDRRMNLYGSKTSGSSNLRHQYEKLDAYSANLDLDKKVGESTSIFYGAEYVYNLINSNSERINVYTGAQQQLNPRYPNASTWQTMGLYLSAKHQMNSKFLITSGMRYSIYRIKALFDTSLFVYPITEANIGNGALNGSLGFVFTPQKSLQVYMNTSTGFRAPNIDDIGKVFDSQPGSVIIPNPNLKPEYAYNAEIGSTKAFSNFLKLDLALYYTYLSNALVRRPFTYNGVDSLFYNGQNSRIYALQNANHAYVYGAQSGVEIYFGKGISLTNHITWQVAKENNSDSARYYALAHATPVFGNIHLMYAARKIKLDFYVNYHAKMQYEDFPLSEILEPYIYAISADKKPFVPAWHTLNFKAGVFISKNFNLMVGVENILDALYRPFSSGINGPGRNFLLSLRYKL
ncbi:MAG: TonB-dependent receptor [Sphingobacteriaceae bacterium]|nr:TonB-dependent receptor [Sphingobacteriaceae bacterium]